MSDLVSIIIPVFNVDKYIGKTIETLLNQTYLNIEILLIDDGSTDKSGKICDLYAEKYNKIKVFHQKNKGVSSARNLGINNAKGKYIIFVDGDDYVTSEYVNSLYNEIIINKADMAVQIYNANDREAWNKAIPYVTRYSYDITPFYTVGEVYNKVIKDLKDAEVCLEEDRQLVQVERTNIGSSFTDCRVIHMNLYAVQALLARVYWMKQDMDSAAIYAKKVIDSQKFPLMTSSDFVQFERGVLNMKETIFGLYAPTYASNCYSIFGKTGSMDMLTLNSNYESWYRDTQGPTPEGSDLRLSAWFGSTLEVSPACVKMINSMFDSGSSDSQYSGDSYLGVNLIRIPEMYYIMAEALLEKDPQQATAYFDKVIESRGMVKFADREEKKITSNDIFYERRKEFYGEGQQWFNMKRLKVSIKFSESNILDGRLDKNYRMLIPNDEDLRDNYE